MSNMDKDFVLMCKVAMEYMVKNGHISYDECKRMFGCHGERVYEYLKNSSLAKGAGSSLCITKEGRKLVAEKYFDNLIEEYEKEEYGRILSNKSKEANIKSNVIAKWALFISIISATGLPQYLLKWIYKTIVSIVSSL